MREVIGSYKNGNYTVVILSDGTLIRACKDDVMIPEFPDSMDIKLTNRCDKECAYCFTSDMNVLIENKNVSIKDIHIGDTVKSFDEVRGAFCMSKVTNKFERFYEGYLICIELESGETIKCTPNHKILTKNRGWVEAVNLNGDDILYDS